MACPYLNVCKYIQVHKGDYCEEDPVACLYIEPNKDQDKKEFARIKRRMKLLEKLTNEDANNQLNTLRKCGRS